MWDSFWYEGELSCLFADSNVGKSILAVQIADRIARTDNVLYLDFELSEKQFQLRYTNEHGKLYTFLIGCLSFLLLKTSDIFRKAVHCVIRFARDYYKPHFDTEQVGH